MLFARLTGSNPRPQCCSDRRFCELIRPIGVQPTTPFGYSAYKQTCHGDCRCAQRTTNKKAGCFTLQTKQPVVASEAVCMFTITSAPTERRASQVSFGQDKLLRHKDKSRHGEGGRSRTQESTGRGCDFTDTLLVLLILLTTEIATCATFLEKQSARALEAVVLSSAHCLPPSSLHLTRMNTKVALVFTLHTLFRTLHPDVAACHNFDSNQSSHRQPVR